MTTVGLALESPSGLQSQLHIWSYPVSVQHDIHSLASPWATVQPGGRCLHSLRQSGVALIKPVCLYLELELLI